jgi:diketogulonate reductase-like aldo/keto reductase
MTCMERRPFGPTKSEVSVVGQGTWHMDQGDRQSAVGALRGGQASGMSHLDTAEMYGDAEQVVADAVEGRRDQVFLVSKVLPHNASRKGAVAACERSLARLRTDRLDCYLLHWPGNHPLEDTVAAFDTLQRHGKIRSWGVSNFDVDELQALHAIAGPGAIACNQVLYHLRERAIEHSVIPWCEAHDVSVVAYSPFGHDSFPSPRSTGGRVLQEIANAHEGTPRQVALRFLIRRRALFAIPKAADSAHVAENAASGGVRLTDAELARIDAAFPRGPRRRGLPML